MQEHALIGLGQPQGVTDVLGGPALRTAWRLAWFVRMRNSQVRNDDRSSKRSIPRSTPSHVSWTTSSATARSRTYIDAKRTSVAW